MNIWKKVYQKNEKKIMPIKIMLIKKKIIKCQLKKEQLLQEWNPNLLPLCSPFFWDFCKLICKHMKETLVNS